MRANFKIKINKIKFSAQEQLIEQVCLTVWHEERRGMEQAKALETIP